MQQPAFETKMTNLDWDIYGKFFALMKESDNRRIVSCDGKFTTDDIRDFCLHTKLSDVQHGLGAMVLRWKVKGLIENTGRFLCSRIDSNHGHRIAEYHLKEWNIE